MNIVKTSWINKNIKNGFILHYYSVIISHVLTNNLIYETIIQNFNAFAFIDFDIKLFGAGYTCSRSN